MRKPLTVGPPICEALVELKVGKPRLMPPGEPVKFEVDAVSMPLVPKPSPPGRLTPLALPLPLLSSLSIMFCILLLLAAKLLAVAIEEGIPGCS